MESVRCCGLWKNVIHTDLAVIGFNFELLDNFYRDGVYNAEVVCKLEREMDLDESWLRSRLSPTWPGRRYHDQGHDTRQAKTFGPDNK